MWASIGVTSSYSSRLFLCALVPRYIAVHKVFMSLVLTSMLDYQYDVPPYKLDAQKGSLYTRAFIWILIARIDRDASL